MDESQLEYVFKKSKSNFGHNLIKKFEHGKDEFRGWKACKKTMIFKEAKVGAKKVITFATWTYSLAHLKFKLWWRWWGLKWKEKDGASKGKAPFEKGGGGGKIIAKAYHATNVQPETPPNCQKETSITKS